MRARLLGVAGKWQVEDGVHNLIAKHFIDMTPLPASLQKPVSTPSRGA